VRFHDLRHSAATILLSIGVPAKVVQEILGHSQISMTMDTYFHVLPSMQQEAMSKLDELFWGVMIGTGMMRVMTNYLSDLLQWHFLGVLLSGLIVPANSETNLVPNLVHKFEV
jgi:hypothetical protein